MVANSESPKTANPAPSDFTALVRLHLRFGWWALCGFVLLGIVLEGLHGLKLGFYLDLSNATRRHMWTLAHAHGTLLGLINIAYALTLRTRDLDPSNESESAMAGASVPLLASTLLLPLGFLLGGVIIYAGDPGLGIVLAPIGGFALLYATWRTARAL